MLKFRMLSATALTLAVLTAPLALVPTGAAQAQIGIGLSITVAPPPLPVYEQPPLPEPGYIWTPGYWDYAEEAGYYWVPGTWVEPPQPGLLWTPGYWGYENGIYGFNRGYWGPHVGFYGGINYGFGYGGEGYEGGEWRGREFAYNRTVNNFGPVHVTNVYERTVINRSVTRVSFNGPNGIAARPRPQELAFAREPHIYGTPLQQQHVAAAARNPELRAAVNHGRPAIAATPRPAEFGGAGMAPGRGGPAPMMRTGASVPGSRPNPDAMPRAGTPHPGMAGPGGMRPSGEGAPGPRPRTMGMERPAAAPHPMGMERPESTPRPMGMRPEPAPHAMGAPGGGPRAMPGAGMAPRPAMQAPQPAAPHPAGEAGREGGGPHGEHGPHPN